MLEETLTQIFYRAAAHHGNKYPPKEQDVKEVVGYLAAVMQDMGLTILPNNLLNPKPRKSRKKKEEADNG